MQNNSAERGMSITLLNQCRGLFVFCFFLFFKDHRVICLFLKLRVLFLLITNCPNRENSLIIIMIYFVPICLFVELYISLENYKSWIILNINYNAVSYSHN